MVVVHHAVREIVDAAADERRRAGLTGSGSGRDRGGPVRRRRSQRCRALGRARRGYAHATPPRLSERGLGGQPTLVQNVETLAHLALIARYGAAWFRDAGHLSEPGSMLVTIWARCPSPACTRSRSARPSTRCSAGPAARPPRCRRYCSAATSAPGWAVAAAALPFSAAGLATLGASAGAGLIAALPDDACGLAETARVARYLADESAGQCGPCLFGLTRSRARLSGSPTGRTADLGRLRRWLGQADGRGACLIPTARYGMVRSALNVFGDEIERHAAGWCRGTRTGSVLPVPPRRQR